MAFSPTGGTGCISRYLPPLVVYGIIYYLSSRPAASLPDIAPDIVAHFIEYTIFGFFFVRMVLFDSGIAVKRILAAFPAAVLLAVLDEVHQYYVPTRHFEFKDILVDAIGILAGTALYIILIGKKKSNPEQPGKK